MKLMAAALFGIVHLAAQPQQLSPLLFFPLAPCRAFDTRVAPTRNFEAGEYRIVNLQHSACGLPPGALAYALNATIIPREDFAASRVDQITFIQSVSSSIFPRRELPPTIRNPEGIVMAREIISRAGIGGLLLIHTTHQTHLAIDVNGYWTTAPGGLDFIGMQPCRLVDTRIAPGVSTPAYLIPLDPGMGSPSIQAGPNRTLPIGASKRCGELPENAGAYALNITAIPKSTLGYLTIWPSIGYQPSSPPLTSVLNSLDGRIVTNSAIVANVSGFINVYATDDTDLIVDLTGYFAPNAIPLPWR